MRYNNSYSEKLKDPRWQKKRLLIFERDKWTCRCCGDNKTTLNVHHLTYAGEPWECPDENLTTLCEDCHAIVSTEKLDMLNDTVEIRKIQRPQHLAFLCISDLGATFYVKTGERIIERQGAVSHDVLKYVIQDVINYWLKTDRDHYLTEKLTASNG